MSYWKNRFFKAGFFNNGYWRDAVRPLFGGFWGNRFFQGGYYTAEYFREPIQGLHVNDLTISTAISGTLAGAHFDGTDGLTRSIDLNGDVDGPKGTISFWLNLTDVAGNASQQRIFCNNGANLTVKRLANGKLYFEVFSDGFSDGLAIESVGTYFAGSGWHHVLMSWKVDAVAGSRSASLYIDDVLDTNKTIDFGGSFNVHYTGDGWSLGEFFSDEFLFGELAEFYFNNADYFDFSVVANRRKFITAVGEAANLGDDGSLPTAQAGINRFYFAGSASSTPALAPAFSAQWTSNTGVRRSLLSTQGAGENNTVAASGTGAANTNVALRQYISDPLVAQTIGGTLKGQILSSEQLAADDCCAQIRAYVIAPNGVTIRGVLYEVNNTALSSEFGLSEANRKFPRGGAVSVSSVTAQAGDYLVIEIGFRQFSASTDIINLHIVGNQSTDLPEDEVNTGLNNAWIEFSQAILFGAADLPIVYLRGPASVFNVNHGTGGDFVFNGVLTNTTTSIDSPVKVVQTNILLGDNDLDVVTTIDSATIALTNHLVLIDLDVVTQIDSAVVVQTQKLIGQDLDGVTQIDNVIATQDQLATFQDLDVLTQIDNITISINYLLAIEDLDTVTQIDTVTLGQAFFITSNVSDATVGIVTIGSSAHLGTWDDNGFWDDNGVWHDADSGGDVIITQSQSSDSQDLDVITQIDSVVVSQDQGLIAQDLDVVTQIDNVIPAQNQFFVGTDLDLVTTIDNVDRAEVYAFAPQDLDVVTTIDNDILDLNDFPIVIDDITVTTSIDFAELSPEQSSFVDDLDLVTTIGNADASQSQILIDDDLDIALTLGSTDLTVEHALVGGNLALTTTLGNTTLSQDQVSSGSDLDVITTIDTISLTQNQRILVDVLDVLVTIDANDLTQAHKLVVAAKLDISTTIDSVDVTQDQTSPIADVVSITAAGNVELTQSHLIVTDDLDVVVSLQNVDLLQDFPFPSDDLDVLSTLSNVVLTAEHVITTAPVRILVTLDDSGRITQDQIFQPDGLVVVVTLGTIDTETPPPPIIVTPYVSARILIALKDENTDLTATT